jgi:hypothetical protein
MVLYTVFAKDLIKYINAAKDVPLRTMLANINETCTQFIHLMSKLYTDIYQL